MEDLCRLVLNGLHFDLVRRVLAVTIPGGQEVTESICNKSMKLSAPKHFWKLLSFL